MNKQKIVSFDVDGTLIKYTFNKTRNHIFAGQEPNHEIINILKNHVAGGDKVIIVTSRNKFDDESTDEETSVFISVKDFCKKYDIVVDSINYTNGHLKAEMLKNLNVDLHYDDNDEEIYWAREAGILAIHITDDKNGFNDAKALQKEYFDNV